MSFYIRKNAWECDFKMLYTYVWLPGLLSKSNCEDAPYFEVVFCIYHFSNVMLRFVSPQPINSKILDH